MLFYKDIKRKNPLNPASAKFYWTLAPSQPVTLRKVADEIAEECTVTSADIKAVLDRLELSLKRHLSEGHSIRFGDLGSFHLRLNGPSSEEEELVNISSQKHRLMVRFTPSVEIKQKLSLRNPAVRLQQIPTL